MTTEPQTEAGRKLRDYLRDSFVYEADDTEPMDATGRIIAVELEATEQAMLAAFDDVHRIDRAELGDQVLAELNVRHAAYMRGFSLGRNSNAPPNPDGE